MVWIILGYVLLVIGLHIFDTLMGDREMRLRVLARYQADKWPETYAQMQQEIREAHELSDGMEAG